MAGGEEVVAGRYRIVHPLGAGGMGRVWLAVDQARRRRVAIKKCSLPDGLTEDEQLLVLNWTAREARAVARVRHPNVVRIHDVLTGDEQPWIVMEYVPSRSLLQLINSEGVLPAGQVARIGLAVLHALRAARDLSVLHLDVKPSNVLIADDRRVMLTDFGPAVTGAGIDALHRAGVILGSPNYVAPERLVAGDSTARADLWSLGATLYHAAEGRPPYARATTTDTLRALIAGGSPDPPRLAGPLIPLLDGLLRPDPADRIEPAEAEEHLRRLADARPRRRSRAVPRTAEERASPAGPAPVPAGSVRWRIRGRVAALAAGSAVVAALAVVAATDRLPGSAGGDRARAEAPAPVPPAVAATGPFVLPPRFRWWNDRSGFGVAVPSGWPTSRKGRDAVLFTAPGGQVGLRVGIWTPSSPNMVTALLDQERDVTLPGYRRLRIEALPQSPDAVWEYTFRDPEAGQVRVLQRIVTRGGRTYRIEWHTPGKAWANELQKLEVVVTSLRSIGGG